MGQVAKGKGPPADMGGNDSRPILIMGSVVTEDGSPLPRGTSIKSICSGKERIVAYPHSEGKFEFRWGDTSAAAQPDASQADLDSSTSKLGFAGMSTKPGDSLGGVNGDQITNCELGVNAIGYRSSTINLYNHSSTSSPSVGVMVLHRIGANEGHFVSAAAMQAPKDAKKAWDEGMLSLQKNQRPEALESFQKAVKAYPTFADAWLKIGILQVQLKGIDAGNDAFLKAMQADEKLVGPWQELGFVAAAKADWPQTAHYLDEAVKLDPVSSPKAWYLDATAHYNLKHYDEAERTARTAIQLDTRHQNPREDFLLGLILIAKEDYKGGATMLKSYMDAAPNAGDLEMVRGELARIQEFIH
jgi:Tfp pilus assembly protein PilF